MDGSWPIGPIDQIAEPQQTETAPETTAEPGPEAEKIETWTEERVAMLVQLWEEGITTAEIGRRIGVTKNAVIGKVHRIGLVPRVVTQKPPPRRNPFDFTGPACLWPHGHPGEDDFHFCCAQPIPGRPYCADHAAIAYLRPKEKAEAA